MLTTALSYPRPHIAVCSAVGEVDSLTAPRLREQLHTATRDKPRCLVVDLSAVTFFSAAGVNTLHAARDAQHQGQQLVLVAKSRPVVRVLDICQVPYPRYCNLDRALAACDQGSPHSLRRRR